MIDGDVHDCMCTVRRRKKTGKLHFALSSSLVSTGAVFAAFGICVRRTGYSITRLE